MQVWGWGEVQLRRTEYELREGLISGRINIRGLGEESKRKVPFIRHADWGQRMLLANPEAGIRREALLL